MPLSKIELTNILNEFPTKKILVIGDVMLDKYTIGHVSRINPEAPVPVLEVEEEIYKPGGAGNVALNVKSLSQKGEVFLFGFIGDDPIGRELKRILESQGIRCYFELNSSTIMKERIIGKSSGQQQQMVRIDREETSNKNFDKLSGKLLEIAEIVDKIIISDYAKGSITPMLMNNLQKFKNKIIVDPKPKNPNYKSLYLGNSLITPNRKEAFEMSLCDNILDAGKKLRDEYSSNILLKLGKEGMMIFPLNGEIIKIETVPQHPFEETGAGDTAIAAIALSLSVDSSLEKAARLGDQAAKITVNNMGAYAPNLEELKSSLKNENNESGTT